MKTLLFLLMFDAVPPEVSRVEAYSYTVPGYIPDGAPPMTGSTFCDQWAQKTLHILRVQGAIPFDARVTHYECRNAT